MNFQEYIYPELVFLIPFLNLVGWWMKHKTVVQNRYIPITLGALSVVLSTLYIYTTMGIGICDSIAQGILQGVFIASTAVYANQLTKTFDSEYTDYDQNEEE